MAHLAPSGRWQVEVAKPELDTEHLRTSLVFNVAPDGACDSLSAGHFGHCFDCGGQIDQQREGGWSWRGPRDEIVHLACPALAVDAVAS